MSARRSLGVTFSAIATILGSAILILFALFMLWKALVKGRMANVPTFAQVALYVMCFVVLALAGWGITTAVGLLRQRSWSRISLLVFSSLLAFVGASGGLSTAFMQLPSNASPEHLAGIKIAFVAFYAALGLIGLFWLFYFNTTGVRAQFGMAANVAETGGRPLSVSIIAWSMLLGSLVCLAGAFSPFPAMVFGILIHGWAARVFFLGVAACELWLGIGLLRLKSLSRVLSIAFYGFGIINGVLFAILPGRTELLQDSLRSLPSAMRGAGDYGTVPYTSPMGLIVGCLLLAVPIWFLVVRRQAFAKQSEHAESPEG